MFDFVSFPLIIFGAIVVIAALILVLSIAVRRYITRKVEALANERLAQLLAIKDKAVKWATPEPETTFLYKHKGPKEKSRKYERVTVIFADIQGFTRIVEQLNPESLIDELDRFFLYFDEVVEKNGIEKIKTIGDAYMAAGGLPVKNRTNPVEVVLTALEMQQYMKRMQRVKARKHEDFWELRIGIHTGPIISGMVGRKKISFDIWGDTVNIASRMESSGVAGEINITGVTWQLVKGFFEAEYRGKMPIKYKGETDMFFIKGIIPQLSVDGKGQIPNELFKIRLQHIRYTDLEENILERLKTELPPDISYHNHHHTMDVITQSEIIGRGERISEKEMLLLKTAALFHDTGFLIDYHNHEDSSMALARTILPRYHYTREQIETVCELINVTRPGGTPKNHLEAILSDADLDYLGRSDFIPVSEALYRELQVYNGKMSPAQWNDHQLQFISNHRYYTKTAKELRQVNKENQLHILRQMHQLQLQNH